MIGHYVFHIGFVLSCIAFIAAIMNPNAATSGLAGQPIEQTLYRRPITIFVFGIMVLGFGSGVVACLRRDARYRRINELKNRNQETANKTPEHISEGRGRPSENAQR